MAHELPIDPRSPHAFWDDQHKKLASNPLSWTINADGLLRSFELLTAQTIEDQNAREMSRNKYIPRLWPTAMMLAGFAAECMLKAIFVSQNPAFNSSGKFDATTHDLLKLADGVDLPLTKDERILLERLEQFLTWAGRYPVPLYAQDMHPRTLPSGGSAPLTSGWIAEDFQQARAFLSRLRNCLPRIADGDDE
jgi:hypothetical protein